MYMLTVQRIKQICYFHFKCHSTPKIIVLDKLAHTLLSFIYTAILSVNKLLAFSKVKITLTYKQNHPAILEFASCLVFSTL